MTLRVLMVGTVPEDLLRDLALLEESVEILAPAAALTLDPAGIAALRPHLLVLGQGAPLSASALYARQRGCEADDPVPSLSIVPDPSADLIVPADGAGREQILRLARRLGRMRRALAEGVKAPPGPRTGEAFRERIEHEFARALRYRHPVALIVVSLDARERLAASYGDAAVEEFMAALEETLRRCVRDVDLLYRSGPDELAAILPETPATGAKIPAARFLTQTSRLVFKPSSISARPMLPFKATSSVGVADGPGLGVSSAEDLLSSARASMGSARIAGGARVSVHGARVGSGQV